MKSGSVKSVPQSTFATPQTVAHHASLFMEFVRQEYWNGLPFPSPGDLPEPGIELVSPVSPALVGNFFTTEATWEAKSTRDFVKNVGSDSMTLKGS